MKVFKHTVLLLMAGAMIAGSCQKLDLDPLSEGSSENWFNNEQEISMALNALYAPSLWNFEARRAYNTDRFSDDWNQRVYLYDWLAGTITGEWGDTESLWAASYKGVARANTILYSLEKAEGLVADKKLEQYAGEAKFFRACFYSYLVFAYGDVPYYTGYITLEEAYKMGRINKETVLEGIYRDFDEAAQVLPERYVGTRRITKGAAYAFKARIALWMNDWKTCRDAAKACIDLGTYSLSPDYREIFLSKTKDCEEVIFDLPNSNALGLLAPQAMKSFIPRNNGGTNGAQPSWELFFAYPCTDGKMVDESPLWDPADPFKNRDPRLSEVCLPFGEMLGGIVYDPRPSAKKVPTADGVMVKNKDNKSVDQYASYNGLTLKKGIDEEWLDDYYTDASIIIMRYADVLLMFAEAKMELGEIDSGCLAAINKVRARAYKVDYTNTSAYPSITETDQAKLRRIISNERRIELAWENRRWEDLIRWRLCGKALTTPIYGTPSNAKMAENEATGYWLFPKDIRPKIDKDGIVDCSAFLDAGYAQINVRRGFTERQYLFPIPTKELLVCDRLVQNEGY